MNEVEGESGVAGAECMHAKLKANRKLHIHQKCEQKSWEWADPKDACDVVIIFCLGRGLACPTNFLNL